MTVADAHRAIDQGFEDLKAHQVKTYAAMQHAITMLMADFDPKAIEQAAEDGRGISGLLVSRKAKLWDAYDARWQAKVAHMGGGPIEAPQTVQCHQTGGGIGTAAAQTRTHRNALDHIDVSAHVGICRGLQGACGAHAQIGVFRDAVGAPQAPDFAVQPNPEVDVVA